jgi:hypothetical protein
MEGACLPGLFERQMREGYGNGASIIKLIWALFLDPDYIRSLDLGAIWNCCGGPGLPWFGIRVWGTKGLF